MNKQKLQLHQFEVEPDTMIEKNLYVYKWPQELVKQVRQNNVWKLKVPITNLSQLIDLVFDDVIATVGKLPQGGQEKNWIFALDKINEATLINCITEWLMENGLPVIPIEIGEPKLISSRALFEKEFANDKYAIIPRLYSRVFCEQAIMKLTVSTPSNEQKEEERETSYTEEKIIKFHPVISNEEGGRTISNTFELMRGESVAERFSYAVTFTLVGSCEFPTKVFLNVKTSTKAWIAKPLVNEDKNASVIKAEKASAYIYRENLYLENKTKKLVKIGYQRNKEAYYEFADFPSRIFAQLTNLQLLDAFKQPNAHNKVDRDDLAEVTLLTNKTSNSDKKILSGAGLPERIEVFKICKELFPQLIVRETIQNVVITRGLKVAKRRVLKRKEVIQNRQYINLEKNRMFYDKPLRMEAQGDLVIEIFTHNEQLVAATKEYVGDILSLHPTEKPEFYRTSSGQEVIFVHVNCNIARGLSMEEQKEHMLRYNEAVTLCKKHYYHTKQVLSLIDIEPFHQDRATEKQDCKEVLRWAFRDNGRITQFINGFNLPEENENRYRLINAIYDLLTAVGFMRDEYFTQKFDDYVLLGLTTSRNSKGKLAILSKIEKGHVTYKIYKSKVEEWLPFADLLPHVREIEAIIGQQKLNAEEKNAFHQWIVQQLNALPPSDKPHILYFDAALRQRLWAFASNSQLNISQLRLLHPKQFKFIRINTTTEVPNYHIVTKDNDSEGINRNQGLFTNDNRIFYNVASKADTIQVSKSLTKIEAPNKNIPKQQLVEFAILVDSIEECRELAMKSYVLRTLHFTSDADVKYPLPIHLIHRFGEYLKLEKQDWKKKKVFQEN